MRNLKKPARRLAFSHQSGFTLLELAIVLTILGLLVAGGSLLLEPLMNKGRRDETNARLDQIEKALILFAANNKRLPCPSNPSVPPASLANGIEPSIVPCVDTMWFGGLPWRSMGLSEADVLDGWGRRISYAMTSSLSSATALDCPTLGFAGISQGKLESRGANNAAILPAVLGSPGPAKAAYVLISHGENGTFARLPSGEEMQGPPASQTEDENAKNLGFNGNSEVVFYYEKRAAGDTVVGFDDIVRSKTAGQIAIEYGCTKP